MSHYQFRKAIALAWIDAATYWPNRVVITVPTIQQLQEQLQEQQQTRQWEEAHQQNLEGM